MTPFQTVVWVACLVATCLVAWATQPPWFAVLATVASGVVFAATIGQTQGTHTVRREADDYDRRVTIIRNEEA